MGGHLELLGFIAFLYCSHCLWGSFFPLPREPHSILWTLDDHVVARPILFSHLEPQPCLLPRIPTADISGWSLLYRTHTAVFPGKALTLTFLGNTNVTIPIWGSSCSLQNSISCLKLSPTFPSLGIPVLLRKGTLSPPSGPWSPPSRTPRVIYLLDG